jgi:tRNA threonylcarbamoyladenosine biosynthesis protein TsaB
MFVVGLETSGLIGSVALLHQGRLLEEASLGEAGRRHAQSLVLELQRLLRSFGAKPCDVQAIAVSKGPGSFTGLRVGLVCAKTFAYATNCQFVAVDTFEAIASNCPPELRDVWIVENAQRGELFVGRYARAETGLWIQAAPIQTVSAEEWLAERTANETLTGPGLAHCDSTLVRAKLLTDDSVARPKAGAIAQLGLSKLLARDTVFPCDDFDFWKAVPFYIRPSAAEEQRAKRNEASSLPKL